MQTEFKQKVMNVFFDYYSRGLTPNPCAICNRDIKFGLLFDLAKKQEAELLATGHYAKLEIIGEKVFLKESENKSKDQSYFLSLVPIEILKQVKFPLASTPNKETVRKLAAEFGIHNSQKKDSQDICFIPDGDYKSFLKNFSTNQNLFSIGNIVLKSSGQVLTKHHGIANYTIGQRRGLQVSYKEPLYVTGINAAKKEIFVGTSQDLNIKKFFVHNVNWLVEMPSEFVCKIKLRSICKKIAAKVRVESLGMLHITLLENANVPVAPGQICCFYDNDLILAGGIITLN